MRFLQGLIAIGGPEGVFLTPSPTLDIARKLRLFLDPQLDAADKNALVVRSSMNRLLSEIGLVESGENIKALKASLVRMSNITMTITQGTKQASFHLLSYAFDEADGRLFVALNPRLTEAVIGKKSYTYIPMDEVRAISADPTRLIHQRLCGWIDPGKSGRVEIDTLCGYVWSDKAEGSTMRMRKKAIRDAINELSALGWKITEYAKEKYEVKRPPIKKDEVSA
jgi:hypothetical protein